MLENISSLFVNIKSRMLLPLVGSVISWFIKKLSVNSSMAFTCFCVSLLLPLSRLWIIVFSTSYHLRCLKLKSPIMRTLSVVGTRSM